MSSAALLLTRLQLLQILLPMNSREGIIRAKAHIVLAPCQARFKCYPFTYFIFTEALPDGSINVLTFRMKTWSWGEAMELVKVIYGVLVAVWSLWSVLPPSALFIPLQGIYRLVMVPSCNG